MSVTNVNSFESRVSNQNYLTNYTDPYLKQSLANLGQRLSVKGDSIVSGKFLASDLFPNYLGDLGAKNVAIEFTYIKDENNVIGKIVNINEDGTREIVGGESTEASSTITIKSANKVISNLTVDDYPSEIWLRDSNMVNGSLYWHRNSVVMSRTYDSRIGKDVLIYKIVGHHDQGVYGEYDNEYICEEITVDGEFVEGFRIFMTNEENLMITNRDVSDKDSMFVDGEYEKLVMTYLHKDNDVWKLDCYKGDGTYINDNIEGVQYFTVGDVNGNSSLSLSAKISEWFDPDGTLLPNEIKQMMINNDGLAEATINVTGSDIPLFTYAYTLKLDEYTEDNVGWTVNSFSPINNSEIKLSDNKGTKPMSDDYNDQELIESKLEYFVNDVTEIFPTILSIYDDVLYRDDSNLKLKQQIMSHLVLQLMSDASKQDGAVHSSMQDEYSIIMPTDLEVNYNVNSNDSSIIYNTISSIVVSFLSLGTDKKPGKNIVESLSKIWNNRNEDNEKEENAQLVFAHGYDPKTAQYDFFINYIDDDIISDIEWTPTFVLPYINNKGYWVINDIITDQYARSVASDGTSIVMTSSYNDGFNIIFGLDGIKDTIEWEKKEFAVDYVTNSSVNLDGTNPYKMSAYLPSDNYLKEIAHTDAFAYFVDTLFVCTSSMDTEVDAIRREIKSVGAAADKEYNANKDALENDGYQYFDGDGNVAYSYIYKDVVNPLSLTYALGKDTTVTSFWGLKEKNDGFKKSFEMTYIKQPGKRTALDFSYLLSLPNYIKYYSENSFVPDNYLHRWVVFSAVNTNLKNNTKDNNRKIYPVVQNRTAEYYAASLTSNTKSFGSYMSPEVGSDEEEMKEKNQQYKNNMNFSIEFSDGVVRKDGIIESTTNSVEGRHFGIGIFENTYQNPIAYISVDKDGHQYVKVDKNKETIRYGVIPDSIQYSKYPHEFIPNAKYDANDEDKSLTYQYPMIDLAETLERNVTSLNRYNILGVDQRFFNGNPTTIFWNAYIGFAWDGNSDKSHLKIGTSDTNPNLGTTTMVNNEDQSKLTPIETLDIDMSYVNLCGDVEVSGNFRTNKSIWNATDVKDRLDISAGKYEGDIKVWSSIITPVGSYNVVQNNNLFNQSVAYEMNTYNSEDNTYMFNVRTYIGNAAKNEYHNQSKYYPRNDEDRAGDNMIYSKSYLNVTKLLNDNGIVTDYHTIFSGDANRLTVRYSDKNEYTELIDLIKLQNDSIGVFNDAYTYLTKENVDIENCKGPWVDWMNDHSLSLTIYKKYFNDNTKYIVKSKGLRWSYQNIDNEDIDCVYCNKVGDKTNTIWCDPKKIPGGYEQTEVEDSLSINTIGLKEYNANVWLELSSNVTDKENQISSVCKPNGTDMYNVVVGNPIQISYVDIPHSYTGKYTIESIDKIYTYMFVDGTEEEKGSLIYSLVKDDKNTYESPVLPKNATYYAYNEVWMCDGCDKCTQYSCSMIAQCNKSKVVGSYIMSYGFFRAKSQNDINTYLYSNVYKRCHERYGKSDEDNMTYKYLVVSYYPLMEKVDISYFDVNKKIEALTVEYDNKKWVADSNGIFRHVVVGSDGLLNIDKLKYGLCDYVYIGKNILCEFQDEWIYKNQPELDKDRQYSYVLGSSYITNKYIGDNPSEENKDIRCANSYSITYWEWPEHINGYNSTTGVAYRFNGLYISYDVPKETYMNFSYYETVEDEAEYYMSYRYVNVRELLSNNSEQQFYNGKLFTIGDRHTVYPMKDIYDSTIPDLIKN